MTVDTHFHVFEASRSVAGARYTPAYAATLPAWQTAAQARGVTHGVLVQTSFTGTDNTHLLAQLAGDSAHLRGIAVVAPHATADELTALHAQGVRGLRINLSGGTHDMTAWRMAIALWDAVFALGWHVQLHADSGALPAVLADLPRALPLVLDHFAKPHAASQSDATVLAVCQRQRVHIKLSAPYRLDPELDPTALAKLWLHELGPAALLWGSDWPCTNHEAQADYAQLHDALANWLGHDGALLAQVRDLNPMALYWR
jgi:predicted TIM-barrel fold metal-dependent hydrolase